MSHTLVLNASFEPLCVVPLQRAVLLVLSEKATVLHSGEEVLRSAQLTFSVPTVIRLARYVRVPYRRRIPFSKRAVLLRDQHRCQFEGCGRRATTIDHVLPRSRGGGDTFENCVAACTRCNNRKADRLLSELGWTLVRPPAAPSSTGWLWVGMSIRDGAWEPYLTAGQGALVRA